MDDVQKMREYLSRLDNDSLLRFYERVYRRGIALFRPMTPEVREEIIALILSWRELCLLDWQRACKEAGIIP